MKRSHEAFARAQKEVADARSVAVELPDEEVAVEALHAAEGRLAAAEKAVQTEFDAAWQRNIDAVQAAKQRVRDGVAEQLQVDREIGVAVAARTPPGTLPVLTAEERERGAAVAAAVEAAVGANREAEARFKQGVTAEQLAG